MKDEINLWLSRQARLPGVLACGIRYPDRSSFTQQWAGEHDQESVEKSLACLSDVWRLLRLSGLTGRWLRWGYPECWFYSAQRPDGTLLGLIAARSEASTDPEEISALLQSFLDRP
ncbi:MAG: hypothetical protein U1G07_04530 [Verrucomicrobiota bacterium]